MGGAWALLALGQNVSQGHDDVGFGQAEIAVAHLLHAILGVVHGAAVVGINDPDMVDAEGAVVGNLLVEVVNGISTGDDLDDQQWGGW